MHKEQREYVRMKRNLFDWFAAQGQCKPHNDTIDHLPVMIPPEFVRDQCLQQNAEADPALVDQVINEARGIRGCTSGAQLHALYPGVRFLKDSPMAEAYTQANSA